MQPDTFQTKAQIVYLSHGGGPLPILGDASHKPMRNFMRKLPSHLHKPDAIVVVSAHWEETAATLLGAQKPLMFHDHYNFQMKHIRSSTRRLATRNSPNESPLF